MASHQTKKLHVGEEKKLTLKISDHSTGLQKQLYKQWTQGQHCDLAICGGSCQLTVHSCVVSCFSAKISQHLLRANMACSVSMDLSHHNITEDGVAYYFSNSGEKSLGVDVKEELLKALVEYMYTGCLSVSYYQTVDLLHAAQLLGFDFLVSVIELFLQRNPDVVRDQRAGATENPLAIDETTEKHVAESRQKSSHSAGETACTNPSTATSDVSKVNEDCGDPPVVHAGLNIKQEVIDPDVQELLDFSAQVENDDILPVSNEQGQPDSQREAERDSQGSGGSVTIQNTQETEPAIKQEVMDSGHSPLCAADTLEEGQENGCDSDSDLRVDFYTDNAEDDMNVEEQCSSLQETAPMASEISCYEIDEVNSVSKEADSETFICKHCQKSFCNQRRLKQHISRSHKGKCKKATQRIRPQGNKRVEKKDSACRKVHGEFMCEVEGCDFKAVNAGLLRCHLYQCHKKCLHCDYQAPSVWTLKLHSHEKHAMYQCSICQKRFFLQKKLNEHQQKVHQSNCKTKEQQVEEGNLANGNLDCESAPSIAASASDLSGREDAEPAGVEILQASGLEAVLEAVQSDLAQELNVSQDAILEIPASAHHLENETPLQAAAAKPGRIRRNKHATEMKQCRLCGQSQKGKELMYQHLRNAHAEDCFSCQQCSHTFLRKEGLTKHIRIVHEHHTWTCPHCQEIFNMAESYSTHCRLQHNDHKPFRCQETASCRFSGRKLSNLVHHREHVHRRDRTFGCDKCGDCFPSVLYLSLHQRSCLQLEQHLCSICGEVFNLRSLLRSHIRVKHWGQRLYGCTQCGRRFSCHANRNRHMRIHDNAFPYVCENCGQKFRHSNSLKDHVFRKHGKRLPAVGSSGRY